MRNLLCSDSPITESFYSKHYSDNGRDNHSAEVGNSNLFEFQLFCKDYIRDNNERVDYQSEKDDSRKIYQRGHIKEIGNQRGAKEKYKIKDNAKENIEIESGTIVSQSIIFAANECDRKTAFDKYTAHDREDCESSDITKVFRSENTRCDNSHEKGYYLITGLIKNIPDKGYGGFLF